VSVIEVDSNRITGIELSIPGCESYFIFSLYLPAITQSRLCSPIKELHSFALTLFVTWYLGPPILELKSPIKITVPISL
jgi:hypothetical protein